MTLTIHVEPQTFHMSAAGLVTGSIWLELSGRPFPEPGWNDFPIAILVWWIDAVETLHSGHATDAALDFMDGPMLVRLSRDQNRLEVRAELNDQIIDEGAVTLAEITGALVDAARIADAECARREWKNADIATLRDRLRTLARHLPN